MQEEYFDVFDKDGRLLRRKELRGTPLKQGEYRKIVQALLINPEGQILLTLRSKNKSVAPGLWECTAGCVLSGEETDQAVIREVFEETGIALEKEKGEILTHFFEDDCIFELWHFPVSHTIEDLVLDENEVESARYASIRDIEDIIANDKATKSLPLILKLVVDRYLATV